MRNILVLGGTRFFGRKLVEQYIKEGNQVVIITRGQAGNPFGDKVEHLIADRSNKTELEKVLSGRSFDLVHDNICFSPNDAYALCDILDCRVGKLVLTSTLSTYDIDGDEKEENDFDPYHYEIHMGDSGDFSYGEGKRQAEAVFFQKANFPVVAVRIPIVLGLDDYTRRLHFHVERVQKGEAIGFVNLEAEMSFIQATEAADFLNWAGVADIVGPYNATANGRISLADLIKMIEAATGKSACITFDGNEENLSPFAVPLSWYMSNKNAMNKGFQFSNLLDWLQPLVVEIAAKKES